MEIMSSVVGACQWCKASSLHVKEIFNCQHVSNWGVHLVATISYVKARHWARDVSCHPGLINCSTLNRPIRKCGETPRERFPSLN